MTPTKSGSGHAIHQITFSLSGGMEYASATSRPAILAIARMLRDDRGRVQSPTSLSENRAADRFEQTFQMSDPAPFNGLKQTLSRTEFPAPQKPFTALGSEGVLAVTTRDNHTCESIQQQGGCLPVRIAVLCNFRCC
jgi:hypothetical protein